jgi:hypothetical protein
MGKSQPDNSQNYRRYSQSAHKPVMKAEEERTRVKMRKPDSSLSLDSGLSYA